MIMTDSSRIVKREVIAKGQWLELNKTHWKKLNGDIHHWEGVSRVGKTGCVMMIPRLKHSGDFILVEQFRPPLGSETLEFPAGLIDEGENHHEAAIRELKEETGYTGIIQSTIPPRSLSPGLSSECIAIVLVEIDETSPENLNPTPQLESTEEGLKVHRLSLEKLLGLLESKNFEGAEIEAKLSSFILGYCLALRD